MASSGPHPDDPKWGEVDRFLAELFGPDDPALEGALRSSEAAGLPSIQVSAVQGRLLGLLARLVGARTILEIGTLGGYSTIWLARALPPGGRLTTLEIEPTHAQVERANLDRAGLSHLVDVVNGPARDSLARLVAEGRGPFDFVFLDADKPGYPEYLAGVLRLARPGTLLVADNVIRHGAVDDPHSTDPRVQGVRRFLELLAADPRLEATALQTVGSKGYDGWALARVRAEPDDEAPAPPGAAVGKK
ncbi:MAG: O-methyltransferase [Thermoplasmata archaeon]|nr:O-methyltransferase [Thermoplasmata archaeon]